ncbi:MAG: hypothetical protein ACJAWV_002009 [Flammeovirgaceae bacterium]|jgi:hypothetical protein
MEALIIGLIVSPLLAIGIMDFLQLSKVQLRPIFIFGGLISTIHLLLSYFHISAISDGIDSFLFSIPFLLIWITLLTPRLLKSKPLRNLGIKIIIIISFFLSFTILFKFSEHGNKKTEISNHLHQLRIEERLTGVPLNSWGKEITVYRRIEYLPFLEKRISKIEYDAHYGKGYPEEFSYKLYDDRLLIYSNQKVKGADWSEDIYLGSTD